MSFDRRRLLYGDWTWVVRDWLDVLRIAFIAGTIAFAVMGRSTAVGLTAASALLLIVRIIGVPRRFDFGVIAAMTLIAWGTALGLYGDHYFYDNVVHTLSPFFYSPVLYIALVRLRVLVDPQEAATYSRAGVFVSTLALGMAVGAGYEVVEWVSDKLLGTHLVHSLDDTGSDLLEDTIGSLAGATLVTVWSVRHWSSRRVAVVPAAAAAPSPLGVALDWLRDRRAHVLPAWPRRLGGLPLAAKGLVGMAAGTVLLAWPSPALRTVAIVFGVAVLAHAGLDLVELLRARGSRGLAGRLAEIAAEVAVGVLVLAWPQISRLALLYAIGASSVVLAFLEAAALSTAPHSDRDRWLRGAASAAAFVFGVALLGAPRRSVDAMVAALGLYLLVLGALRLVRALQAWRGRAGGATDEPRKTEGRR
ncbi:MAG TPA: DUF308 domain-containing protein [Gaiellaceae bacterium]|nr:DUF308 domain-containing protein [Gaiellaceae bacterium]